MIFLIIYILGAIATFGYYCRLIEPKTGSELFLCLFCGFAWPVWIPLYSSYKVFRKD